MNANLARLILEFCSRVGMCVFVSFILRWEINTTTIAIFILVSLLFMVVSENNRNRSKRKI